MPVVRSRYPLWDGEAAGTTTACGHNRSARTAGFRHEDTMVKVIASSLRKGNVVEVDDRLYVILTADNIHPGKGTPVTQLDMRRIADGQEYVMPSTIEDAGALETIRAAVQRS